MLSTPDPTRLKAGVDEFERELDRLPHEIPN
jgi:hypothetical protein